MRHRLGYGLAASLVLAASLSAPGWAAVVDVRAGDGSLAAAITEASDGDKLRLSPGVHAGGVSIDKSIELEGSAGAIVDGGGLGHVLLVTAPDVAIRNLTIRNSGISLAEQHAGVFVEPSGHRALVEGNRIEHNLIGIYFSGPEDAVARGNTIVGRNDLRMNERGNGVHLWNTPGSKVIDNDVQYGRDGIFVTTSRENEFRDNRFRDLRFGIHYMYTNDSAVIGNLSEGNHAGFALMFSQDLDVRGNVSRGDRDHGVLLNYANTSRFEENLVEDGGEKCVFIYNSNKNAFAGNWFEGCEIGIHFTAGSERNEITRNAFVGNQTQVKYVGSRWLDWSSDGVGNYWSDNPAFDLDRNGTADAAYRPNDVVDQVLWRYPAAKLLISSPIIQILRWAQSAFPAVYPGGVIDSAPLMGIPRPGTGVAE